MVKKIVKTRRNKPKFQRSEITRRKRIANTKTWRKPKGQHARVKRLGPVKGASPKIGYRTPKEIRGLHPSGHEIILVSTPSQLDSITEKQGIKIANVGKKKKIEIIKKAMEKKIKILNVRKPEEKLEKIKKKPKKKEKPKEKEEKPKEKPKVEEKKEEKSDKK